MPSVSELFAGGVCSKRDQRRISAANFPESRILVTYDPGMIGEQGDTLSFKKRKILVELLIAEDDLLWRGRNCPRIRCQADSSHYASYNEQSRVH
jgi:hypothetical protein